jgi:murein DD-endopeptidase MepM/ murein hydrolase activator NlpD
VLRRAAILVVVVSFLAAPAAGEDIVGKKQAVDAKIATLNGKIAAARQQEGSLTAQIASLTGKIRTLEGEVGDVSLRLDSLQHDLSLHQTKLARLTDLYRLETQRLQFLRGQYRESVARLNHRLVGIYESDSPDAIAVLLSSASFTEIVEQVDFLNAIGEQDKRIANDVAVAKARVVELRAQTAKIRTGVASEARVIAVRAAQTRALRDQLLASQQSLSSTQSQRKNVLSSVRANEHAFVGEVDALQMESAALEARIQAAEQAAKTANGGEPTQAPGTLAWPVSGPITSPFGMRWGKLHPGIDIGVPTGTPTHAAAAGTVIYAGGMLGYGNLVVIDHGGGIATAYAHQSSIAVHEGQQVGAGDVIGYSGCTGFCTGPHHHFEVRVNGSPVDPLGYLG